MYVNTHIMIMHKPEMLLNSRRSIPGQAADHHRVHSVVEPIHKCICNVNPRLIDVNSPSKIYQE